MILSVVVAVSFAWLGVLTWFVYRTKRHYDNLVAATQKERLTEILDELLKRDKRLNDDVDEIRGLTEKMLEDGRGFLQNVSIVRYNPFEKRGREQSFVIAFLDRHKNGIVMNFMYTPDGLRVFSKKVIEGKGQEIALSDEEKKTVES